MIEESGVAVIIPAYNVKNFIIPLLNEVDKYASKIIIVDDACPENSGKEVELNTNNPKIHIIYHRENKGVGGSVMSGYKYFLNETSCNIAVKIDGDGQMDPIFIPALISPLQNGSADYSKGNRFHNLKDLGSMPTVRLIGNSILSLINKMINGYWHIMDPTNGYTAISRNALLKLDLSKIDKRYFFESDMLFRLGINRMRVSDVPMTAIYGNEKSGLRISKVVIEFPAKYAKRFIKRIFYNYFLRDFNAGSLQLIFGSFLSTFGVVFGAINWILSIQTNNAAKLGTIMIAALPLIIGSQLLLGFLNYDVQNSPK